MFIAILGRVWVGHSGSLSPSHLTQFCGFKCRWKAPKFISPTWISSLSCSFRYLTDYSTFPCRCLKCYLDQNPARGFFLPQPAPPTVFSISAGDTSILPIALAKNLGVILTVFVLYSASNQQILLFLFQNMP